ncbi:cbb3-type cytochrome c oxidase N-terminal domain-containing protein [Arundinibacter roseus]|uniref:C-type cytochrome n=1 Tax=Arundinibacter roseus TaxID=2070510 RepID=A0A4R4K1S3_9BACT|nr:cbb3-type cytochrome c oxidase N-terminal domain-containing protein [Arundinibacter roseus]TDB61123.1 c-type cytochrome [Arundinibacter roseus]
MKFKNYLETIAGISIYPLISLVIFFAFFVTLIVYVMRMDRKTVDKLKAIPLDDSLVKKSILTVLGLLVVPAAFAQDAAATPTSTTDAMLYTVLFVLACMIVILVVVLLQVVSILRKLTAKSQPEAVSNESAPMFSSNWWSYFSGFATPLSEEEKIIIKGHDYDGIHELDNRMPPWLQFLFVGTVVIAIGYVLYYHTTGWGDLQEAELEKELAVAEVQKQAFIEKMGASIDENTVTLLEDEGMLKEGGVIFQEKCAACHAADGGGGVGPNLTDDYWIHGGDVKDVFKTVKYGVPEKGMISWEKQLKPLDMQKVSSYIKVQLQGTKPASPKAAEGTLQEAAPAAAPAETEPVALN